MPAIVRFIIPFGLAALVTFGLFWLMQSLIGVEGELDKSERTKVVDFVRVKRSEDVKKKEREPPKKEEIDDTVVRKAMRKKLVTKVSKMAVKTGTAMKAMKAM